MSAPFNLESTRRMLESFLVETFEDVQSQPLFINKGTSIFLTLERTSAREASYPMGRCATIAAHVEHIRYYLEVLEEFMFKREQDVNWETIWETVDQVDKDEWQASIDKLKMTYERIKGYLSDDAVWQDSHQIGVMMGIIVHSAYHLGEIRQMRCRLKSEVS